MLDPTCGRSVLNPESSLGSSSVLQACSYPAKGLVSLHEKVGNTSGANALVFPLSRMQPCHCPRWNCSVLLSVEDGISTDVQEVLVHLPSYSMPSLPCLLPVFFLCYW